MPVINAVRCLSVLQVCNVVLNKPGSTIERHPEHMAPYGYIGETWVGYDDVESLSLKVNGFMLKKLCVSITDILKKNSLHCILHVKRHQFFGIIFRSSCQIVPFTF